VLETLAQMTINTFERSGLDLQTYMVARLAALVAIDAAPASYLLNLGAANEFGIPMDVVRGTLVAVAPSSVPRESCPQPATCCGHSGWLRLSRRATRNTIGTPGARGRFVSSPSLRRRPRA
jgi:hypothetical protein